ncbi:MAG: DUF1553 domain-containing protein, partial [Planctomycetaceae bacterium]|nr:DUF1553 domain-containing protein [Planctomycetaceae bacterium]
LLDWLAVEFAESGWNVKALQKQIVLSAAYRQSSRRLPDDKAGTSAIDDPDNRRLSRGPRRRLSARQLRDQALFVSGLLNDEIGGASVNPYQPEGLWDEMSNMKYRQSVGKDLYRRGLYTFWKRTVAPPGLAVLDAADRESCTVRPKRTNTPLQALTLLNETTFVESARHLAANLLSSRPPDQFIPEAFRRTTSRRPTDRELKVLTQTLSDLADNYREHPESAEQVLSVGESKPSAAPGTDKADMAAAAMLCNVLLNLDEAVSIE